MTVLLLVAPEPQREAKSFIAAPNKVEFSKGGAQQPEMVLASNNVALHWGKFGQEAVLRLEKHASLAHDSLEVLDRCIHVGSGYSHRALQAPQEDASCSGAWLQHWRWTDHIGRPAVQP